MAKRQQNKAATATISPLPLLVLLFSLARCLARSHSLARSRLSALDVELAVDELLGRSIRTRLSRRLEPPGFVALAVVVASALSGTYAGEGDRGWGRLLRPDRWWWWW